MKKILIAMLCIGCLMFSLVSCTNDIFGNDGGGDTQASEPAGNGNNAGENGGGQPGDTSANGGANAGANGDGIQNGGANNEADWGPIHKA